MRKKSPNQQLSADRLRVSINGSAFKVAAVLPGSPLGPHRECYLAGLGYHTRVSPKDLSIFINLANLLAKNASHLDEADALLMKAISLRQDNVEAYQNRGSILVRLGR